MMLGTITDEAVESRLARITEVIEQSVLPTCMSDLATLLKAREWVYKCQGCNGNSEVVLHALDLSVMILYREILEKERFRRLLDE